MRGQTWPDRAWLALLAGTLPIERLAGMRLIVTPGTILRWHRDVGRRRWSSRRREVFRPTEQRIVSRSKIGHGLLACGSSWRQAAWLYSLIAPGGARPRDGYPNPSRKTGVSSGIHRAAGPRRPDGFPDPSRPDRPSAAGPAVLGQYRRPHRSWLARRLTKP